jgi:preprotein translocase subunit YajC
LIADLKLEVRFLHISSHPAFIKIYFFSFFLFLFLLLQMKQQEERHY